MFSPRIIETLDSLGEAPFEGEAFRHIAHNRHPLSGAGARTVGGRWNPPQSFATLYLGLTRDIVQAEFRRMALRYGRQPADYLPRQLHQYRVEASALVDLTNADNRESLGLSEHDLVEDDLAVCQKIGEAAQHLGYEGILAPSAAGEGRVLAIYIDRLRAESVVEATAVEDFDPAQG